MDVSTLLARFTKDDTSIEHYDGCPSFIEMTGAGFTRALFASAAPSYEFCASFFRKREGDYLTLISDQKRVGETIVRQWMEDKHILCDLYERWHGAFSSLITFYDNSFGKDLLALDDAGLLRYSDEMTSLFKETVSMPGMIDGFMFYADKRLDATLREFCEKNGVSNYPQIFAALGAPTKPSFLNEEADELQKIVTELVAQGYSGNVLVEFISTRPEFAAKIQQHLLKFSWIKSSYAGYVPYTLADIEREVNTIMSGPARHTNSLEENARTKRGLIEKHGFTPEVVAISEITELLVKWQDERKHYTLMFVTLRHKVLEELAKRSGIDLELLRYSEGTEFAQILGKELEGEALRERESGCVFVYQGGKTIGIVAGDEAIKFFERFNNDDLGTVREFKGMVASVGKVRGVVRIVTSIGMVDNVSEGDILVAPMTRPEHLPAMLKAAAIVTDDGGITCHAAIVSRELKKPCVIGTKIATKVLKDGDMIEVDAEKGIITILS